MRRTVSRGFTLVELLIASLLSGIVLTAIYFVFIANSKQYYTQEQVVQMQETMRFALELMKSDLRNAGQLAIVNGTTDATRDPGYCGPLAAGLRAVDLVNNSQPQAPANLQGDGNDLFPDQLRILADGSGGTLLTGAVAGASVALRAANQQGSRAAATLVANVAQLTRLYGVGNYLRVLDQSGQFDLVPISGAPGAGGIIGLDRTPCVSGIDEVRVNVVQLVRYSIQNDAEVNATQRKTNLVREVLNVQTGALLAGTAALNVAEYAINLQVWGTYDARPGAADPPSMPVDPNPTDDIGNWANTANEADVFNTSPHRIRALNVLLATRSAREDAELHTAPDKAKAPAQRLAADRTWFDVTPEGAGVNPSYARVTTLTARVETPNLRTEGNP